MSSFLNSRRFTSLLPLLGLAMGCKGSDVQVATYNTEPLATIQEPGTGTVAAQGEGVNFRGLVQDGEDDLEALLVTWSSDLDGVLADEPADSSGATVFNTANLSAGSHAITLEVIDSGSLSARDSITITIDAVASAPTIQIRSPEFTDGGVQFEEFNFEALVSDEQDAPEDLKIAFTSDVDGTFCEPTAVGLSETSGLADCDAVLTAGPHVLEFTVTDTDGNVGTASIGFIVAACPTWFADADFDGFGNGSTGTITCDPAAGTVQTGGDCNDMDKLINPAAIEGAGDSIDQDCDGTELCYVDGDSDGFRNTANTTTSADTDCADSGEFASSVPTDCNDADVNVKPGATDNPDDSFVDTNCDSIDGDASRAIFVAPSPAGNDSSSGMTPGDPVASLARAVTVASAVTGRDQILVQSGSYSAGGPIALTSGDSWYGGYGPAFTSRSNSRPTLTSTSPSLITVDSLSAPTVIDRINLTSANASGPGAYTLVVRVNGTNGTLALRYLAVTAGDGASGTSGSAGVNGSNTATNGASASGSTGGSPGGPGGGSGASGVYRGAGPGGAAGSANGSPGGGSGGAGSGSGGLGCSDGDPLDGGPGGNGQTGIAGSNGAGGNGTGTFSGAWSPSNGGNGGNGGIGGGGGGGGAGGGENAPWSLSCLLGSYFDTGRGGGGGGGGGAAASAGTGGGGGGASIGIGLTNSTITLDNVTVTSGNGGAGGAGASGGAGGGRGTGGNGATRTNNMQGNGGRGGDGGTGGAGGCGGGGGGGPTVPIWGNGSATVNRLGTVTFSRGSGGPGGGSCSSAGVAGVGDQDTRSVTLQ